MQSVGFVGVGRMGANMARRLKDCGYAVSAVFDVNRAAAESLASELGARSCQFLAEVTQLSDVIITVVTDDAAMRAIYADHSDNLLTGAQGKLFLNCATVSPAVHIEVMTLAAKAGADMLETPMASSITQAREGTLYLMCAGLPSVFERATPVLEAMSASRVYTGPAGTASTLKALVNMVMNMNTAALAEGLGLADALGLDLDLVRTVFAQTGANSRVLETDGPDMQHRDHDTYFSAEHAAKDSGIALTLAQNAGLSLPLAEATKAQYDAMLRLGLGDLDKSGIAELTFKGRHPVAVS